MIRASQAAGFPRPWMIAVVVVVLSASLWFVSSLWTAGSVPRRSGDSAAGGGWSYALLLLALVAVIAFLAMRLGALLERQRQAQELRETRAERLALARLMPDWLWQTDATHRLSRMLPPHAAPAAAWSNAPQLGQFLWEHYAVDPETLTGLRSQVQAQAAFDGVPARRLEAGGRMTRWHLRGAPVYGSDGRFSGYFGSAQRIEAEKTAPTALPWLDALTGPAFLVIDNPDAADGTPPRLVHLNRAARELVNPADPLAAEAIAWPELMRQFPEGLRSAAETVTAHAGAHGEGSAQIEGWMLHARRAGTEPVSQLLTLSAAEEPTMVRPASDSGFSDQEAFSYTVSHDLRAPIRVVEGFARIVKEDYGRVLDRIGIDHLDRVLGAAARMNSMIDALLNLSQLSSQPLAREPVNLSQLAGYVVDDLGRGAPERQVDVQVQPGLVTHGDPTLLRVVLENLLGNAWKYTARSAPALIWFESKSNGERTVYCVRDNGAGFDMRFADRLFGVFQRLHSVSDFQGTGVGLASVRRIVRRHGGDIWAESEVGRGASFYFTLRG